VVNSDFEGAGAELRRLVIKIAAMAKGSAPRSNPLESEGDAASEWRFQKQGMVFGPVPLRILIEQIYAGELDGEGQVSRAEGEFRLLKDLPEFTLHLAKASAKLKVEEETRVRRQEERRGRNSRWAVILGLATVALGGAGAGALWWVQARHRLLLQEIDEIPITSTPPELTLPDQTGARGAEDEVALPGPVPQAAPRRPRPSGSAGTAKAGEDLVTSTSFDQGSLISAEIRQRGSLIPCIKQELGRQPNFRGEIRFSFAVGNDGRVAKLWLDDAALRDGPIKSCFESAMSAWHFGAYQGERATLSDAFRVGR
jgi:hypothetical protein